MSYQVLARKYRPSRFSELVGQEHVSKALIHALENNRLHHAYLFSGTRGCGKTTIARILAKCLNCEEGVSAEPCGVCSSCVEISEGRFVDLIEVDAASRTRVEDTRELLDNVQYAPTRGRYKVYLIDEVHMLSNHSFNALLKTLEEPPAHVKFLFATTDPQKLPVTILSRCLQFNLTELPPAKIQAHLVELLSQEEVEFEEQSLFYLGEAAKGSLRDALSLTDQAIAFSAGKLTVANVTSMLGTVDRSHVNMLLRSLSEGEAAPLLQLLDKVLAHSPDEITLLDETIRTLHRLAVAQIVPEREQDAALQDLAGAFTPEQLQLYYDIAVRSRRDFADVPDGRVGLEMMLLRMLVFRPDGVLSTPGSAAPTQGQQQPEQSQPAQTTQAAPVQPTAPPTPAVPAADVATPEKKTEPPAVVTPPAGVANEAAKPEVITQLEPKEPQPQAEAAKPETKEPPVEATQPETKAPQPEAAQPELPKLPSNDDKQALAQWWEQLVEQLPVGGVANNLARNCQLKQHQDNHWQLALHAGHQILFNKERLSTLQTAIREAVNEAVTLEILQDDAIDQSPDMIRAQRREEQLQQATEALQTDPVVQTLISDFDARLDLDSIKPTAYE